MASVKNTQKQRVGCHISCVIAFWVLYKYGWLEESDNMTFYGMNVGSSVTSVPAAPGRASRPSRTGQNFTQSSPPNLDNKKTIGKNQQKSSVRIWLARGQQPYVLLRLDERIMREFSLGPPRRADTSPRNPL